MFVEITEERGEDGSDLDEEDGDLKDNFKKLIQFSNIQINCSISISASVFCNKVYATSTGYILDLIKPPLN